VSCEAISVITLTRHRQAALNRAIASVHNQSYGGRIEHIVIIDDDPATAASLEKYSSCAKRCLTWTLESRLPIEKVRGHERSSVYPRLSRLLNRGVLRAASPWIAFLDDDNEYEPDHLSSLMDCARVHGSPAVHSVRRVFWQDGSPYLEPLFPGASSVEEGARIYDLMCEKGVWVRGTNILRDRVDPLQTTFRNSTVLRVTDPVFLVDQNLWLISRDVLIRFPIPEQFSEREICENTCPDDKMLEVLVRNGVPIVSSNLPTVRYYLGGVSNGDDRRPISLLPGRMVASQ
jgi:glycosyltransferase involved in cell wall biosynthesis